MEETNITINFDAAKLDALEFALRKQRSSVQRRMAEMLQQLYEAEVPEAVREYVDSKTAPTGKIGHTQGADQRSEPEGGQLIWEYRTMRLLPALHTA